MLPCVGREPGVLFDRAARAGRNQVPLPGSLQVCLALRTSKFLALTDIQVLPPALEVGFSPWMVGLEDTDANQISVEGF